MKHDYLQGYSLNDPNSLNEAFEVALHHLEEAKAKSKADSVQRFESVVVTNYSRAIKFQIGFAQGLDERGTVPSGYVKDTGLMVCGVDLQPGAHVECFMDKTINCLATRVKYAARLIYPDGVIKNTFWNDAVVDSFDDYIESVEFWLNDPSVKDGLSVSISFKTAKVPIEKS